MPNFVALTVPLGRHFCVLVAVCVSYLVSFWTRDDTRDDKLDQCGGDDDEDVENYPTTQDDILYEPNSNKYLAP